MKRLMRMLAGIAAIAVMLSLVVLPVAGCAFIERLTDPQPEFDLQAHRGGRGLAPENTLAAFRKAIALGVTTLETDLAMTRDGVLVLAHDPYLNPALVRGANGQWVVPLADTPGMGALIHSLDWTELAQYDIGRMNPGHAYARGFPQQQPVDGERFATLDDLLALVKSSGRYLRLNIETKLSPLSPDATPDPQRFARAVIDSVRRAGLERQVTVQSFDWRTLVEVRRLAPRMRTACLTSAPAVPSATGGTMSLDPQVASPWHAGLRAADYAGSAAGMVKAAGCETWSMNWRNLTAAVYADARSHGLRVLPWTVNEEADMRALIEMGVDGIITDYPDRLRAVMSKMGKPLP